MNRAPLPNISGSGWKVMRVPRRLCTLPCRRVSRRRSAHIGLRIKRLIARHLDLEPVRQRIDDRHANAVQTARRFVGLAAELAARMQRCQDHFQRRLVLEFRVRIDGDAAPVVGHRQAAILVERHLDPVGVSRDGLVHRVVEDFGEEVMQRLLVGAANIHARPPPHGLEPLQHLDVLGRIGPVALRRLRGRGLSGLRGGLLARGDGKEIVGIGWFARLGGDHELETL